MASQAGGVKLEQDVPNKVIFSDSNYTSTADSSINRRHVRLAPSQDVTFSPRGIREIEFNISSQTSFVDFPNMYITGFFLNKTTYNANLTTSTTAEDQFLAMIEKGGIDSLFETIILENNSTSVPIQKIENYNTWCALHSHIYDDPNVPDYLKDEFNSSGNTMFKNFDHSGALANEEYYRVGSTNFYAVPNGATALTASYLSSPGPLILDLNLTAMQSTPPALSTTNQSAMILKLMLSLQPGDEFRYTNDSVDKQFRVMHVRNLTGDVSNKIKRILLQPLNGTDVVDATNDFEVTTASHVFRFWITNRGGHGNWRTYVGSSMSPDGLGDSATASTKETRGEKLRFCWKPKIPFFWMKKYYPLFLHASGFRLRCILDPNVYHAFYGIGSPTKDLALSSLQFNFELTNVRLGLVVYDFHSTINKQYLKSFQSQKGLLFPFRGIHYSSNQITTAAGNSSISVLAGIRSAKNVITRMTTDQIFSASTVASHFTPSLSAHPSLGLKEYQYQSGSLTFPQRPIELDDQFHMENRMHGIIQTKKKMDKHEVSFDGADPYNAPALHGISPSSNNTYGSAYYGIVSGGAVPVMVDGATSGIMTAILAREVDGKFAGLDLSLQPLKLEMTFQDAVPATIANNRVLHTYVYYDAYLQVNEGGGFTILQ